MDEREDMYEIEDNYEYDNEISITDNNYINNYIDLSYKNNNKDNNAYESYENAGNNNINNNNNYKDDNNNNHNINKNKMNLSNKTNNNKNYSNSNYTEENTSLKNTNDIKNVSEKLKHNEEEKSNNLDNSFKAKNNAKKLSNQTSLSTKKQVIKNNSVYSGSINPNKVTASFSNNNFVSKSNSNKISNKPLKKPLESEITNQSQLKNPKGSNNNLVFSKALNKNSKTNSNNTIKDNKFKSSNRISSPIPNSSINNSQNISYKNKISSPIIGSPLSITKNNSMINSKRVKSHNTTNIVNNVYSSFDYNKSKAEYIKENKDVFCYYDPYSNNDFEYELITRGERIYMKNLAEKNLKSIIEERKRKLKVDKISQSNLFKPNLLLTAYYKTSNYKNNNYLLETTCFKNKTNNYNSDINNSGNVYETNDDIKLEDEIELLKQERKFMSPEKLNKHINRLYKDYEIRQVKQEKLKENYFNEVCPHSPVINDNSEPKIENFYNRLQDWLTKKKEKDEKRKKESELDRETNKPLFKPQTIEYSQSKLELNAIKNRPTSPIKSADVLHNEALTKTIRRSTLLETSVADIKKKSEQIITSEASKKLNQKNKDELFKKIFEILDFNKDNKICYNEDFSEGLKNVPPHIINILEPLFEEFNENKEILTLKEFIVSCGRLYNILDYYQRSQLFQYIFYCKKQEAPWNIKKKKEQELEDNRNFSYVPKVANFTNEMIDKSDKYKGSTFMDRNFKYLEARKKVMEEGLEAQLAREKIGILNYILLNYFNRLYILS